MEPTAMTTATSADAARHIICHELARLAHHGCGQFRVRWFPLEDRIKFEGERDHRWQSLANSNFRDEQAASIAQALETIHDKRNHAIEVSCQRKPDHIEYEIRVPVDLLKAHRTQLAGFLESHMFWD